MTGFPIAALIEIERLAEALKRADGWIQRHAHERDHACAECVPDGAQAPLIVVPDFRCVFHEAVARAALAAENDR